MMGSLLRVPGMSCDVVRNAKGLGCWGLWKVGKGEVGSTIRDSPNREQFTGSTHSYVHAHLLLCT